MGHKGSIEAKYTTNKGLLPDELIEEMRAAFKRCERMLDLENQAEESQDPENKTKQPTQLVISLDKVEEMISQGWRFLASLPENRAIVEKNGARL
jgi:hypothetical protein